MFTPHNVNKKLSRSYFSDIWPLFEGQPRAYSALDKLKVFLKQTFMTNINHSPYNELDVSNSQGNGFEIPK